jgi:hypothetical protein
LKPTTFKHQQAAASLPEVDVAVQAALKKHFPEALTIAKAHLENDKLGCDYWLECVGGKFIAVDIKARRRDYSLEGKPEILLETWSNIENNKPGWSRDRYKITDYVMWVWLDTKRTCLVDYRMLRSLLMRHWQDWEERYPTSTQITQTAHGCYSSRCVHISSRDLHREMYRHFAEPVAASTSHRSVGNVGT